MSKIKYSIYYEDGNGYRCSCCRRSSNEIEEYDSYDDAIDRIVRMQAFAYENDETFKALYKTEELEVSIPQTVIDKIKEQAKKKKNKKKKEAEKQAMLEEIAEEKQRLAELKAKYPDE